MLGKAVERFSMREGADALETYLEGANALPLRDYIPDVAHNYASQLDTRCCAGALQRAEIDDDINYSVLALMLLEERGLALETADVARAWMQLLPVGTTYTAERAAYRILLNQAHEWFPEGAEAGFDLAECSDNPFNDWIGAQIRADVYGWVCPGHPAAAAALATADAALSHRGDGVYGAVYVAAVGAAIGGGETIEAALETGLQHVPADSDAAAAVKLGLQHAPDADGHRRVREHYPDMSPVHTLNNLALVAWALARHPDDFAAAVGDVVAAGLDTDCNGATVGGLWGLQGLEIDARWTQPWAGDVRVALSGVPPLRFEDLVTRTVELADRLGDQLDEAT